MEHQVTHDVIISGHRGIPVIGSHRARIPSSYIPLHWHDIMLVYAAPSQKVYHLRPSALPVPAVTPPVLAAMEHTLMMRPQR
jgi:hypothetical protein